MNSKNQSQQKDSSHKKGLGFYFSVTALTLGLIGGFYGVLRPAKTPGLRTLYHSYAEHTLSEPREEVFEDRFASVKRIFGERLEDDSWMMDFAAANETIDDLLRDESLQTIIGRSSDYFTLSDAERDVLSTQFEHYLLLESLPTNYSPTNVDLIKGVGIVPLHYQEAEQAGFDVTPIMDHMRTVNDDMAFKEFADYVTDFSDKLEAGDTSVASYLDDDRLDATHVYSYTIEALFPEYISLYTDYGITDIRFLAVADEIGFEPVHEAVEKDGSRIFEDYIEKFGQAGRDNYDTNAWAQSLGIMANKYTE
jgi:hypothetical protein